MWTMVYFRALPAPLRDLDHDLLEIFFKFANTYTEEVVESGFAAQRKESESRNTAAQMKKLGYSDEDIAGMDLKDG